jgi:hypothetical protein
MQPNRGRSGWNGPPNMSQLTSRYAVNRDGQWECIRQSLYDSAAYPAAGSTAIQFFAQPIGQGTGFGGAAKTTSDTNMTIAGSLPAAQEFLVQNIQVEFWPTTPTVTAQMPAAYGTPAIAQIVNDAYIFARSGTLTFLVGSKNYVQEGPMNKFPSCTNFHLEAAAADVTTAAGNEQTRIAFAHSLGRPYELNPTWVLLISNQNFAVSLTWPESLQAITNPARIFIRLGGLLYRQSQ